MRRGKKKVSKADAEFMKCKLSLNINPTFQELFSWGLEKILNLTITA